jgi:hypothetical protein
MQSFIPYVGLVAVELLEHATAQASCSVVVRETESNGVGIPVVGCPVTSEKVQTSTNVDDLKIISATDGSIAIPAGITAATTITTTFIYSPPSSTGTVVNTTDSAGTTTLPNNGNTTGSAKPTLLTLSDSASAISIQTRTTPTHATVYSTQTVASSTQPVATSGSTPAPKASIVYISLFLNMAVMIVTGGF